MDKVFVKVCGTVNTGKTTVAVIIEKALKEAGFTVKPFDNDDDDASRKREWLENGTLIVNEIASRVEVEIDEVQLQRPVSKMCVYHTKDTRCLNVALPNYNYCENHKYPKPPAPPPPRMIKENGMTFIESIKSLWKG